jgi:putative aldouronate transport system permease protein
MVRSDKTMKIKESPSERIFLGVVVTLLILSMVVTLYPFIYVISMSISDPKYVIQQSVVLFPKGFSLGAYKMIFENKEVWTSYYNTIWFTVVGSAVNILMTVFAAYPLSRKSFFARKFFMFFIIFTMFFGGGMIPAFLLVKNLHLYDTKWAIILPAAISTWNVIITRTFFETIPNSLQESAKIDGCTDIGILFKIVLPLSLPIISVIGLFCAVGFWNNYFSALLYLPTPKNHPLQLYLMKIVVQNSQQFMGSTQGFERVLITTQLKYAIIIVAILPIICVYPFLQKHFVKGVMIGAIKE